MFFDINRLSQETSALRKALTHHIGPANELSHVECQQILARTAGFPNLHACKAHLAQPRFQERHSPYLTGDVDELVDFVQRCAVRDEIKGLAKPPDASWQSNYLDSAGRMANELSYIRQGQLRVSAKLNAALVKVKSESLQQLRRQVSIQRIAFQEVLWKANSGPLSDDGYDEAYADWRLASLSLYLRLSDSLPANRKFENLVKRFDFYRLTAGVLELDRSDWLDITKLPNTSVLEADMRQVGKAIALQLQGGARLAENYFQALYRVRAPANLATLEDHWHRTFPEFRAWHIWCELKPVFAPDADAFWAKRR